MATQASFFTLWLKWWNISPSWLLFCLSTVDCLSFCKKNRKWVYVLLLFCKKTGREFMFCFYFAKKTGREFIFCFYFAKKTNRKWVYVLLRSSPFYKNRSNLCVNNTFYLLVKGQLPSKNHRGKSMQSLNNLKKDWQQTMVNWF